MVVQVRKRLQSHGLEGFLAYTWAHAIDYNQGGGADNIFFADGPRSLMNGDYRAEKTSSQLDQRHRLVVSSSWEPRLTTKVSRHGAHTMGAGWRLSRDLDRRLNAAGDADSVFVTACPFPRGGVQFRAERFRRLDAGAVPTRRAAWRSIRVIRTDARLTKIFVLADHHQLHFNFEVFNVFNHVANTAVNTLAFEATNQVLRPVPNLGVGVASQGYPDGTKPAVPR